MSQRRTRKTVRNRLPAMVARRAAFSGSHADAIAGTSVIAVSRPRNRAIHPHSGWLHRVARMYVEWPAVIRNAAMSGITRYQYIGAYPSRRRPTYAETNARTGGPNMNAFRTLSSAITGHFSRIRLFTEYIEAKNIQTRRKETPKADRIGDFAGRFSRPRSMNGRTTRMINGMFVRKKPQKPAEIRNAGSPRTPGTLNSGRISASLRRPYENRTYQSGTMNGVWAGFRGVSREGTIQAVRKNAMATRRRIDTRSRYVSCGTSGDPGCRSDRSGPYWVGNPAASSNTFPWTRSTSMTPPQWGSATPWIQTRAMWRSIRPTLMNGRMNTCHQYIRRT